MDFKKVSIKRPSDKVISRMRNGHKVRMMKGEGLDIMMKPKSIVTMAKKFATGKGVQIALDPEELMANRGIQGEGIFGKKFDSVLKKVGIKKAAYTVASAAKPFVQAGISTVADMAKASGVPANLIDGAESLAQRYIDDPASLQNKKGLRELKNVGLDALQEGANMYAEQQGIPRSEVPNFKEFEKLAQSVRPGKSSSSSSRESAANMGADAIAKALRERYAARPMGNGLYASGSGVFQKIGNVATKGVLGMGMDLTNYNTMPVSQKGYGLGMGMKFSPRRIAEKYSSLGARGALMGGNIQALTPQPYAENYQFRATLGPMIGR
jgi:hypothetical protein